MIKYSYKGKRNILLWDGMDDGITQETYKMACPYCGDERKYSIRGLDSLDTVPDELKEYISEVGILSNGEVKKDMPAYVVKHYCKELPQTIVANYWIKGNSASSIPYLLQINCV